jgi:hypothetical protein
MGGTVGPDLGRMARSRSFYGLAATMWNHLPTMAGQMARFGIDRPQLDSRETGDLIAFLFTLDYFDLPGNVENGRRLRLRVAPRSVFSKPHHTSDLPYVDGGENRHR